MINLSILLIGLISIYDIYLTLAYAEYIVDMEIYHVSRWIMAEYGVPQFVLLKSFLTLVVCLSCFFISKTKYKIAVYGVAIYQILLFLYLNLSTQVNTSSISLKEIIPLYIFK